MITIKKQLFYVSNDIKHPDIKIYPEHVYYHSKLAHRNTEGYWIHPLELLYWNSKHKNLDQSSRLGLSPIARAANKQ